MDPRLVAVFCDEYTRHTNELRKKQNSARSGFEAELQKLERRRKRCVEAIMDGLPAHQFKDELRRIDERRIEVEGLLSNCEEVPVILHPAMAKYYQQQVSQLAQAVTDPALRGEANDVLRSLVKKSC